MNYHEKIDYLMCKWLVPPRTNHNEFNLRNAFYNLNKPTTKDEMRILVFNSVFSFLSKNDIHQAIECLKLFYLVDEKAAIALSKMMINKKPDFDLFTYILLNEDLPLPYLVLFFNALRVRHHEIPIILRKDQIVRMIKAICKKNFVYAKDLYQICLDNSLRHLNIHDIVHKEEIIDKINSIKKALKQMHIRQILIYGSFARDEATRHSDLDMVVLTRNKYMSDDYMFAVLRLIEDTLGIPVDIHFFSTKIDFSVFDKQIKEDMMCILKI